MIPNEADRKFLEQWIACGLQRPGIKMFSAPVLWSSMTGSGKNLLVETVGSLYGDNFLTASDSDLADNFNDWAHHRQLVFLDEALSAGTRQEASMMKRLITRTKARINEKYKPKYEVRDCINYIVASNNPDAVRIENNDRRYWVVRVSEKKVSEDLVKRILKLREGAGRNALFDHMLRVDLTGFNPHAEPPVTEDKKMMEEASKSDLETFVSQVMEDMKRGERSEITTIEQDLQLEFDSQQRGRASIDILQRFSKHMVQLV